MNKQRSHLTLGLRYFEIQLGILISYIIVHSPNILINFGLMLIGGFIGYFFYRQIHSQSRDFGPLPLANIFITLALLHWYWVGEIQWSVHITIISACLALAYFPLFKFKHLSKTKILPHFLIFLLAISTASVINSILFFWIVFNIVASIYLVKLMPRALIVGLLRTIFALCFRVRIEGLEHYHSKRKRIVIANHQSWLDGLLLSAFLPNELTFAVNTFTTQRSWFKFFDFLNDHVALDPSKPIALKTLIEAVDQHKTVVIFPEGRHTVTGALMKIYEGPTIIALKTGATFIPIRIEGSQYSYFSRYLRGKRRLFPKITLEVMAPRNINHESPKAKQGTDLFDIMQDLMFYSSKQDIGLWHMLLASKKLYGRNHVILEDYKHCPEKYGRFTMKAAVLGHAMQRKLPSKWVGVLLPNSIGFAATIFGLWSQHKSALLLNYSMTSKALIETIKPIGLTQIVTAKAFIAHQKLEPLIDNLRENGIKVFYIDDIKIPLSSKVIGIIKSFGFLNKQQDLSEPALALLSSGSEKTPKTIILSHKNLTSQITQTYTSIDLHSKDVLFNTLPGFHAFGLSVGLLVPVICGIRSFQYPNPLHYRLIPELIYGCDATILLGTNTFLREYAKTAHSYDFYNIRYVFSGGEKLQQSVFDEWIKRFAIVILEGYGTTEASPLISINNRMYHKIGTVGKLIPDMDAKVVPVEGIDEGGELYLKGPNIMSGYASSLSPLKIKTYEDGWYPTGDIVSIDDMGFITIHGRKRRFAKISGEMVSLEAIEKIINQYFDDSDNALIAIKDEKRGEALVLVTDDKTLTLKKLRQTIPIDELNNLMTPKKIHFLEDIPKLPTGKVNYPGLTLSIQ
ncbi:MAG: AMP-binding protein [Pseudomonadota bacterium]|nr:AMP-binding protein [Pseudomonadota bacterium]